jgi:hypothetical protein
MAHVDTLNTTYPITGFVQSLANEAPFYGMRVLCSFAREVVDESVANYLNATYLSTYLTHENEFVSSINLSINNMKTSLPQATTQFLQLIEGVTQGNQILSGAFTNAEIVYNSSSVNEEDRIRIRWINPIIESCNCALSPDFCTMSRDAYCNYTFTYVPTDTCNSPNPYIFITCYPIGVLFASTLTCFYDAGCIGAVYVNTFIFLSTGEIHLTFNFSLTAIPSFQNMNISLLLISLFLLNPNVTSRFPVNVTALTLIDALAIEEWNDNIDYEFYYKNCNPTECLYTITENLNIPTVVTTVIGLFGGLSVVLKILIPLLIKFIRWFRKGQRQHYS